MKLSSPLHMLKSRAKQLKKESNITSTQALDMVAQEEGYSSWSLLHSQAQSFSPKTKEDILAFLNPGDLMLIGARPKLGKTRLAIEILSKALHEERPCYFFSLEFTNAEIKKHLEDLLESKSISNKLVVDLSDEISADYIIEKTKDSELSEGIIVIDYLQLLDQKRANPAIQSQIEQLKVYAKSRNCIVILTSQLNRAFEESSRITPSIKDIRMPNLFDLNLFNKLLLIKANKYIFLKPKHIEIKR